jgi:hypothetical protein
MLPEPKPAPRSSREQRASHVGTTARIEPRELAADALSTPTESGDNGCKVVEKGQGMLPTANGQVTYRPSCRDHRNWTR